MQKTIVITGVSRGLGRALLSQFNSLGHTVVACARNPQTIAELKGNYPGHHFSPVDVSHADQVAAWAEDSIQKLGAPDLLLNNAALMNESIPLWEISSEDFTQLIDVNINGVFHVLRNFLPAMIERGEGVVVNFSSGWGRSVSPDVAPYCASKYAIEGLTLALAAELPTGLAAVPLNPGVIHTDMLDQCFGSQAASFPSAEQWAKTAAPFLLKLGPADNGRSLTAP